METKLKQKKDENVHLYNKTDIDLTYQFSAELHREAGNFIKAIVLFGSTARREKPRKDVDLLVILDDLKIQLTREFIQTYRIIVSDLIKKTSPRLHVTTFRYTTFWEYVRSGDPIAINILRDGVPIIDAEIISPLQALLKQGRIRPTPEAVWSYFYKAPRSLKHSQYKILHAALDLYWAVIDSAHAALMFMGEIPPSPNHVAGMLTEKLVLTGLLEKKYAEIAAEFYHLSKDIEYGKLHDMKGKEYDKYRNKAHDFVERMQLLLGEKK